MTTEQEAYKASSDLYNKEIDRLFQRFNFFLIGTSFLIAAFATLLKGALCFGSIQFVFFYLINLTGFLLSLFFTVTNFFMVRLLAKMLVKLRKIEENVVYERPCPKRLFPYHMTKDIGEDTSKISPVAFCISLGEIKRGICRRCGKQTFDRLGEINEEVRNEILKKRISGKLRKIIVAVNREFGDQPELVAEHTWLVPFFFIHFWWAAALLSTLCRCGIIHPYWHWP